MFCFYTATFQVPLKDYVGQWRGPHKQMKLPAVLVFVFSVGKKKIIFKHLEWPHAPTKLTKCFDYLVLHIWDMLLSRLTDGLNSCAFPVMLQMFF